MNNENGYYDTYFQLDADIAYDPDVLTLDFDNDGTPESNFPGINKHFAGTFDGKNHTISGIRIDKGGVNYQGLFGENDGTVKNVTVSNANISGYSHVGGIVGKNTGTIENCHATATVFINASVGYAGGIVGENRSSISGCTSAATVRGMYVIGGIAGDNYSNATIENCLANGASITATDNRGGAIVGENNCYDGAYNAILSNNYYTGCTLTIGYGNNATTATTNIGCGNKADEDYNTGTYTPTDVTEMTIGNTTYTDGAVNPWARLKNQLANASTDASNPTVITLVCDVVAGSDDERLIVPYNGHAIIDLNAHKIDRGLTGAAQDGHVINVRNNATLVIRDSQGGGIITGGYTSATGGGITVSGALTLEGGTISGNKSKNNGGGLSVSGTFIMTGGTITNNTCGNSGYGSAIYANSGTINLQGGTITGNYGQNAIYTNRNMTVSGTYDVSGNKLLDGTSDAPDIILVARVINIAGAISPTSPATVAFDNGGPTLTSGWSTYMSNRRPSTCFVTNVSGKVIGKRDNELVLGTPEAVYWHADSDHDGTSEKPYVITTTDGLDYLASRVNSVNSVSSYYNTYFQLGADIAYDPDELTLDLDGDGTNESNFAGIGDSYHTFNGSFDGNDKIVSGLRIDKTRCSDNSSRMYVGLFRRNGGAVKNVTVSNANISGEYYVGGIVGNNNGTIENCHRHRHRQCLGIIRRRYRGL